MTSNVVSQIPSQQSKAQISTRGGESTTLSNRKIKVPPLALLLTRISQAGIKFFIRCNELMSPLRGTPRQLVSKKRRLRDKQPGTQNDKGITVGVMSEAERPTSKKCTNLASLPKYFARKTFRRLQPWFCTCCYCQQ